MAFVATTFLIEKLQARLQALTISNEAPEKLLQRVGVFGAADLLQAMRATFASEQRVAFIIPGPEEHTNRRDRSILFSQRDTSLALLFADQTFSSDRAAAVVGGPGSVGILAIKDRIIGDLFDNPFTDSDLCFAPTSGEPIVIGDDSEGGANTAGREAYLLWLKAYAGEDRMSIA